MTSVVSFCKSVRTNRYMSFRWIFENQTKTSALIIQNTLNIYKLTLHPDVHLLSRLLHNPLQVKRIFLCVPFVSYIATVSRILARVVHLLLCWDRDWEDNSFCNDNHKVLIFEHVPRHIWALLVALLLYDEAYPRNLQWSQAAFIK